MNRITKRTVTTLLAAIALSTIALTTLNGCNTVAGAGKDIEAAGDAIEDKAEKEKGY